MESLFLRGTDVKASGKSDGSRIRSLAGNFLSSLEENHSQQVQQNQISTGAINNRPLKVGSQHSFAISRSVTPNEPIREDNYMNIKKEET